MKFFTKIFLTALAAVMLAVSLTEYLLLSSNLKNSLQREVENSLSRYSAIEAAIQTGLSESEGDRSWNNRTLAGVSARIHRQSADGEGLLVQAGEKLVYSDFPEDYDYSFWLSQANGEKLACRMEETSAGDHQILVWADFRRTAERFCC